MQHLIFIFLVLKMLSYQPYFTIKEKRLTLNSGADLLYTISTPRRISAKEKTPLIIALHWGWDMNKPLPPWFGKDFLTGFIQPA